jgi:hypothetical protein
VYGDFSRLTFDPANRFSAVLMQQGRVQLDADTNEQAMILLNLMRTLTADIIGPHGGPGDAFLIKGLPDKKQPADLAIGAGNYYVDGILCENVAPGFTYGNQPDAAPKGERPLPDGPQFLVYLKVFERAVTAVEDPAIREIALGSNGPDTAARLKVIWQVVASDRIPGTEIVIDATTTRAMVRDNWKPRPSSTAMLKARGQQATAADCDACTVAPDARYRGAENQLYRVQIHTGGSAGTATFMWSRENGSVVFPIRKMSGREITTTTLGRDPQLGLAAGDWVEIVDDRYTARGIPSPLQQVKRVDPLDLTVELAAAPSTGTGQDESLHPYLRRWDQRVAPPESGAPQLADDNALKVVESATDWIDLENGIQIQFQPAKTYAPGDFWLIPARTETGDILFPADAQPPAGIVTHVAPLALVTSAGDVTDLRCSFTQLGCADSNADALPAPAAAPAPAPAARKRR